MLPRDLKPELFRAYPPQARKIATENLEALQLLPLSFLPNLLREVIDYDYRFPAERKSLEMEVANLSHLSADERRDWFQGFAQIRLSPELERIDWVNDPAQFVEQLSAYLWTTHQLDSFRSAAIAYADRLSKVAAPQPPPIARLGIAVIGQSVESYSEPLFRELRPHGAYFSHVKPDNGLKMLLDALAARAQAHPIPYGHWYIDGGEAAEHDPSLMLVSYAALAPVREALLRKIHSDIQRPGMGPETLRTLMAELKPADLGMSEAGDPVLDRFQVRLFTEGSGTQIFSTSFAQWAAREALRRAQPVTMLVRFAPRQRQKPMNEMLSGKTGRPELDLIGSLIDADMGAYYNWLNQQRLTGADKSSFLVWYEGHSSALAIGPSMPRGTESSTVADLGQLLNWIA